MSCPYLERGLIALCRAVGKRGMRLDPEETEMDCFPGDFSQCSLLLSLSSRNRRSWPCAILQSKDGRKGVFSHGSDSRLAFR